MGSPMELPWWNCCICILVFCIWLYWIGFAWYRTGKIQTWLFIYQADMSIYTHTHTPIEHAVMHAVHTENTCRYSNQKEVHTAMLRAFQARCTGLSKRLVRKQVGKKQKPKPQKSESKSWRTKWIGRIQFVSDCILFCILSFRRTWNAHRTRQVWSCETCETCERWSFDMCLALRCGCRCVLRRTPWICDSRCQAEESEELFSQAEDEWSGTEAKINEEMKTCFFFWQLSSYVRSRLVPLQSSSDQQMLRNVVLKEHDEKKQQHGVADRVMTIEGKIWNATGWKIPGWRIDLKEMNIKTCCQDCQQPGRDGNSTWNLFVQVQQIYRMNVACLESTDIHGFKHTVSTWHEFHVLLKMAYVGMLQVQPYSCIRAVCIFSCNIHNILFYSILCYSILLYYIILYYIILYHFILYYTILCYIIIYIILYCIILHYIMSYYIIIYFV